MESGKLAAFLRTSEVKQLAYVERLNSHAANNLYCALVKAAEYGMPDVSARVIERLLEIADPDEYLEAAQDADDRVRVTPEALAQIQADRERYMFETPSEHEARVARQDAEAIALNNRAAAKIKPFRDRSPEDQQRMLLSLARAELDSLLCAARRCIDAIEENNEKHGTNVQTDKLLAFEKRIRRVLAGMI